STRTPGPRSASSRPPHTDPVSLKFAILTSLTEREGSGIELARRFDKSIGYFWPATHQQIYRELDRLGTAGLIRELPLEGATPSRGNPRRFGVTPEGRVRLEEWARELGTPEPVKSAMAVRLRAAAATGTAHEAGTPWGARASSGGPNRTGSGRTGRPTWPAADTPGRAGASSGGRTWTGTARSRSATSPTSIRPTPCTRCSTRSSSSGSRWSRRGWAGATRRSRCSVRREQQLSVGLARLEVGEGLGRPLERELARDPGGHVSRRDHRPHVLDHLRADPGLAAGAVHGALPQVGGHHPGAAGQERAQVELARHAALHADHDQPAVRREGGD